jgi:AbrB family looped-hinge helix DNA binding protein
MSGSVRFGIVQKRGQVTIPIELRRKLGVEEGDVVAFVETKDGILISPREALAMDALNRIGQALQKQGITLEELIETGRESRGRMVEEGTRGLPGSLLLNDRQAHEVSLVPVL